MSQTLQTGGAPRAEGGAKGNVADGTTPGISNCAHSAVSCRAPGKASVKLKDQEKVRFASCSACLCMAA